MSEAHAPMMNQGQVVEEKNFVPEKNSEEIPLCLFGLAGEVPEGISNFSGLKEVPEGISNFSGMREMPEGISTVMKEIPEGIPSMSHVAALDPPLDMRDWLVPSSFHLSENKICEVNMIQGEFQENYGAMVVYGGGGPDSNSCGESPMEADEGSEEVEDIFVSPEYQPPLQNGPPHRTMRKRTCMTQTPGIGWWLWNKNIICLRPSKCNRGSIFKKFGLVGRN